ncbi:MAG: C40 family peptidase [Erysipelotrichales bacterium]|uniref:glucosaminidase domain-containing protein n=1 Tax=Thomasclavelia cocleata TaxID=69824 RepID=UPI0023CF691E|nr:glucosaminidase domain-containing protein [Thomasclavelia cocleata]MDE6952806.1 C40 family peptidase [Erysipelotrichales bacterium]
MKTFKKIIVGFFLTPLIVSVLIVLIFVFMLVDGSSSTDNNATVLGLPECVKEEMVIASLECQEKYKHPASVTLAQIIQESSGKYEGLSGLAYTYHNLFGIKADKNWTGKTCMLATQEEDSSGNVSQIKAKFRAYDSYTESIEDRSKLLNSSSNYPVEGVRDAREFANCLKKWATDIDYTATLIDHMDKYNLYIYDNMTVESYQQQKLSSGFKIVEKAKEKLGCKYVWGGGHSMDAIQNPLQNVFDCSSFICWSYYQSGINIGNKTTKELVVSGSEISQAQMQPGDIILFARNKGGTTPSHVSIYVGNGQMIHAPSTGDVVKIVYYSDHWKDRTICCRRLY